MGDGSFDRSTGRLQLHSNWFTLHEVKTLQSILLEKYNISSYLKPSANSDPNRGYIIRIPTRDVQKKYKQCVCGICALHFTIN